MFCLPVGLFFLCVKKKKSKHLHMACIVDLVDSSIRDWCGTHNSFLFLLFGMSPPLKKKRNFDWKHNNNKKKKQTGWHWNSCFALHKDNQKFILSDTQTSLRFASSVRQVEEPRWVFKSLSRGSKKKNKTKTRCPYLSFVWRASKNIIKCSRESTINEGLSSFNRKRI